MDKAHKRFTKEKVTITAIRLKKGLLWSEYGIIFRVQALFDQQISRT